MNQHIVLLRLSALGDCVHASAVVHAILTQRPDWKLSWIIGPGEAKMLAGLDQQFPQLRFFVYRKSDGIRGMRALVRQILAAQGSIDVLLQMQLALRANLLSLLIPAKRRIGFDWQRAKEGHALVTRERIDPQAGPHVQDSFLAFLAPLGLQRPAALTWPLWFSDADASFAREHLPEGRRHLLISPCASHPRRNWNHEGYAAVARYASQSLGLFPILIGGRSQLELDTANAITAQLSDVPHSNLVGKDTLKQLLAMLARADVVLSPDSGPAHMAQALGTPVVGLYACTDAKRSGPYQFVDQCTQHYQAAATASGVAKPRWGQKFEQAGVMDMIKIDEVCSLLRQAAALDARATQRR